MKTSKYLFLLLHSGREHLLGFVEQVFFSLAKDESVETQEDMSAALAIQYPVSTCVASNDILTSLPSSLPAGAAVLSGCIQRLWDLITFGS